MGSKLIVVWVGFVVVNLIVVALGQNANDTERMFNHLGGNTYSADSSYCRIPVRALISAAESATNRILQGVCNPRELNNKFTTLENQIVDQFNVLKTMILNIEDKLRDQDDKIKVQHRKLYRSVASMKKSRRGSRFSTAPAGLVAGKEASQNSDDSKGNSVYDYYDEEEGRGGTRISEDDKFGENTLSVRESEIETYNSTIHTEDDRRVFTYYWTVRDITYRIKNWGWKRSLRSESFYIFRHGYMMYMRIFPNQNGENVYIHVGITRGEYDNMLEWPFKLKHKIQILDHYVPGKDLPSRIWDPTELCSGWNWKKPERDNYECVGLGFPQETVFSRHYLHNDSITIKLTVFLD